MSTVILESHFFPCIDYFKQIYSADNILIEGCESFQKQSYRSRCVILATNGPLSMSLLINHDEGRKSIQTTTIDYKHNWLVPFWRTLEAAYKKSPYFDYFEDIFKPILFSEEENLFVLNQQILKECMRFLGIDKQIEVTSDYIENYDETFFLDKRIIIHPKKNSVSKGFLPYPQNFGETFVENMSIIDLIMNEGPAGVMYLK